MKYGSLITPVCFVAPFPYSNRPVESIFDCLKVIKNEKRSPMNSETLVALIQIRFALQLSSQSAEHVLDDKKLLAASYPSSRHGRL